MRNVSPNFCSSERSGRLLIGEIAPFPVQAIHNLVLQFHRDCTDFRATFAFCLCLRSSRLECEKREPMSSSKEASDAPVRVSVSCLAELIKSPNRSADSVATLLRPFKFNKRGEGFARSGFYKPAFAAIRSYHSNGSDGKIFEAAILDLRNKAVRAEEKWERVKFEKNIDAIKAYRAIYGKRHFRVLTNHRLSYPI